MRELYLEQGAMMLQIAYKYFNSPETTIGKFLLMAASWTQAFIGTSTFFLEDPFQPIPPVNSSYLLDLRTFLQYIHGTIHLKNPPIPALLREHDRCIMDIAMGQQRWSQRQLMQINSCRRHLQAQTLADITSPSGTRLQTHVCSGNHAPTHTKLKVAQFNQPRPQEQAWRTWCRFIRTISNDHGVLVNPLGKWIVDCTALRHWPTYLYDPGTDQLMSHHDGSHYYLHRRIRSHCFSLRPDETRLHQGFGFPTAVSIIMDTLRPERNYILRQPEQLYEISTPGIWSFQVTRGSHQLLQASRVVCPPAILHNRLPLVDLTSCSDGSVTSSGTRFGYVISTRDGCRLVKGHGSVPGSFPNSFRSEAYGVLATLLWLQQMYRQFPPEAPIHLTHYLDNRSVIQRLQKAIKMKRRIPNAWLLPEQDVIEEIKMTISQLPIIVQFEWVRGHQDEGRSYHQLPLEAQLNCEADKEANQGSNQEQPSSCITLAHIPCHLYIQEQSVTSQLKRRVHELHSYPRLQTYLRERFQWSQETFDCINWQIYTKIIKKYKDRWPTLVKHLYSLSPTGKIAHRNNPLLPHECPSCSLPYETHHHVIQCEDPSRAKWRQETMSKVTSMHSTEVDPHMLDILHDGLIRYHRTLQAITDLSYPEKYRLLIQQQNAIGWDQLYKGRWSQEWVRLQNQHIGTISRSLMSGEDWILNAGRTLIDQWYKVWRLRNEERHRKDNQCIQDQRQLLLHNELRRLYNLRNEMLPSDRGLLYDTVDVHLQRHPMLDQIEEWITAFRPVILQSIETANQQGISQNTRLTDFPTFNPSRTPPEQASLTAGLSGG